MRGRVGLRRHSNLLELLNGLVEYNGLKYSFINNPRKFLCYY